MRYKRKWTFDCPTQLSGLDAFREFIRSVFAEPCVAANIDKATSDLMLLALHETLVNVIRYAAEDGKTVLPIRLDVRLYDDRIEWTFAHRMTFFKPGAVPPPTEDGLQERGFGLYIIHQIADRVRYSKTLSGENRVVLVKTFRTPASAGRNDKISL
jgi:anti-sigma regulatory factor (Ser/Thr protein kinase)